MQKELNQICEQIQNIIDKYLLPNATDPETKVFYLKLKGDYYGTPQSSVPDSESSGWSTGA